MKPKVNVDLISSSCVYQINGLDTLKLREVKGKVDLKSNPILSAEEEDNKYIAQANASVDKDGKFQNERVISNLWNFSSTKRRS